METMDFDDDVCANMLRKSNDAGVSAHFQWYRRPSGVASVCLGLLCVLLLAGIVGMGFYYGSVGHPHTTEEVKPANSPNLRAEEIDQLQKNIKLFTIERDQLNDSLNLSTTERDQLQNSLNTMTTERDQLQQILNTNTKEKDQLQSSLSTMTTERDQLQNSLNTMTTERDQLQQILNTNTKEKDQLQSSLSTMTTERDQLQNSLNTTTTERDQMKTRLRFYEKPCEEGWWKFGSSCYYLYSTKETGWGGQQACKAMGADLVVINSREEQIFIHGFKMNVWIGLYKKDQSWNWVDKTVFTSMYWMSGEPSDQDGNKKCVEITQAASDPLKSWNVLSCTTKTASVCEKKAPTQ
ncbi:hypothetical protein DPEC_G00181880 [Dallia pectoralis]|uniref:Uncharacterized protein n=1 Tax=Dallia pectoralis TaxID=75939 RepID=A0ACC2GAK5_DALPE|nr:hypothetical protein DPEC_G00181880 [Dallia pectoralis]